MEVHMITAPGDGVAPAVLLTVGTRLKGQYLFNLPEGFSRMALEHKVRPTLALRAVFATDLLSLGGLAGLIMRLRGEGHGEVQLFGPRGAAACASSLRHFVRWRHPAVCVSELVQWEQPTVYEDEHVAVAALWRPPRVVELWRAPTWLVGPAAAAVVVARRPEEKEDDSESEDSSSSGGTGSGIGASATSSDGSKEENGGNSEAVKDDLTTAQPPNQAENVFGELDKLFTQDRPGRKEGARSQVLACLATNSRSSGAGALATRPAAAPSAFAAPARRPSAKAQQLQNAEVRLAGGREYLQHPDPGISVFIHGKLSTRLGEANLAVPTATVAPALLPEEALLGYVIHIKSSDRLVLVSNLRSREAAAQLGAHPAWGHLQQQHSRVACVTHISDSGIKRSKQFSRLWGTAGLEGRQFLAERPGPMSSGRVGHLAAARTTARLNVVSPRVFPLPLSIRRRAPRTGTYNGPQEWARVEEEPSAGLKGNDVEPSRVSVPLCGASSTVDTVGRLSFPDNGPPIFVPLDTELGWENTAEGVALLQIALRTKQPDLDAMAEAAALQWPGLKAFRPPPPPPPLSLHPLGKRKSPSDRLQADSGAIYVSNKTAALELRARLQLKKPEEAPAEEHARLDGPWPAYDQDLPGMGVGLGTSSSGVTTYEQESEIIEQAAPHDVDVVEGFHFPPHRCPEVTFLGTGSAEPSKYRGASAIHLSIAGGAAGALLDCGEGASGALTRLHGATGATRIIAVLRLLWVSHRHADHMTGVPALLAARSASAPPLLIAGPASLGSWLAELPVGLRLRYRFAHCTDLAVPGHWAAVELAATLGIVAATCIPAWHCSDAWSLVLRSMEGWSLAYSGDTMPSPAFAAAARGVTLMIHEATFDPGLADEAQRKRHSTTTGAMDAAAAAGAALTVLTHFSQRYPKFPEGVPLPGPDAIGVGRLPLVAAAFDGMVVPFDLLSALPVLMPAVEAALGGRGEDEAAAAAVGPGG